MFSNFVLWFLFIRYVSIIENPLLPNIHLKSVYMYVCEGGMRFAAQAFLFAFRVFTK